MKHELRLITASSKVIACGLVSAFAGQAAHAAGVAAGTSITNVATATYTSGTGSSTVQSNTVTVKVDELLNVAVGSLTSSPVSAGSGAAVLAYSVTNSGNGNEAFNLTADPAVSGNAFNGTIQAIAIDSNGNGTYEPGVDTLVTNGAAGPLLAADQTIKVLVLVDLPAGAGDAQTSQVRLTATAVTGTGTPGTVLAGRGDGGVDAVIGASHASSNALDALIASLATVTLTKSATIADPFGGNSPVPGAVVTYSLLAHAIGTGTASGVHVTDAIPAGTTYKAGSLTLGGTALTDAADGDAGTGGAAGIDVSLGSFAGGAPDKTITFQVTIN